jgi:hypothetical protein
MPSLIEALDRRENNITAEQTHARADRCAMSPFCNGSRDVDKQ